MSRIDELIQDFCPKGVEFKAIEELGTLYGGITGKSKDDFKDGNARFITYMNVFSNIATDTTRDDFVKISDNERQRKLEKGDVLFTGSSENPDECGMSSVVVDEPIEPLYLNSFCFIFRLNDTKMFLPEFLKYLFRDTNIRKQIAKTASGVTRHNVSKKRFAKIIIPVPPLEVQNEIVTILDKFTQLEAELSAELSARRRQYEYYRNQLLTFDDSRERVKWLTLDVIAMNLDSKRKPVTRGARTSGDIPYYGASGIVDYVSDYIFEGDYLLVSEDGANLLARSTPIAFSITGKTWVNNHAHILQFEDYATRRLVEIYLNSIDLRPYVTGAAQPKLNKANLNKIQIPIPSVNERKRIVSILDKFDGLVNSISEGLPAEINARRQQYEYYRTKLLAFRELPA